jgi:hypothetical protein
MNASPNPLLNMEGYNNYGFGSNATNLEYSILSDMLGSPIVDTSQTQASDGISTLNNMDIWSSPRDNSFTASPTTSSQLINNTEPNFINSNNSTPAAERSTKHIFQLENQNTQSPHKGRNVQDRVASISASSIGSAQPSTSGTSTMSAYGDGAIVAKIVSPVTPSTTGPAVKRRNQIITPEMAYASATKPFSYADGYHYLINYVKTRLGGYIENHYSLLIGIL